ncbi:MAG: FHA domain-containing protein [Candidatus Promineifilaceae bacterium]
MNSPDSKTSGCSLVLVEGPLPETTFELGDQEVVIGRSPSADFVIGYAAVSGRHALITRTAGHYQIEDLGSSNGTFINDEPLAGRRPLANGDEIRLGQSIRLAFVDRTADQTMVQEPSPDATILEADFESLVAADREPSGTAETTSSSAPADEGQPPEAQAPELPLTQGGSDETLLFDESMAEEAAPVLDIPPQLQVAIAGDAPQTYTLQQNTVSVGRADENDIVILSKIVSRRHAMLERVNGGYSFVPFTEAGNPVLYEGRPLTAPRRLANGDKLRIGGLDPGSMVTMTYISPAERSAASGATTIHFNDKNEVTIGRDPANDVVLDSPSISRYHAQIERVGQRYRVRDLRSSNGTFVNDERIEGEVWLRPDDAIRIGPYRFVMGQDKIAQYDESGDLQVEAISLCKWVRKDLNILQNISLVFQPREFIVVVGQSGGGKSTLVDAIAGYRPATDGAVYVNDINVYQNFDAIRNDIGYVPQRDIIHMELTIEQALDYAAQLRMPPDTTEAERKQRIDEVLHDLDLAHRRDVQISGLSGGQQKRVSIGVELLTKPGLFYLDEPTSGLDPGTETSLMQLMRRLADQGRTIVLITHATKNVMLADKVAFLARGGYLAWFGPPDEALAYFDQYRSERDRRTHDIEFDEIYSLLDDPSLGTAADWAERYRNNPAYDRYISTPLKEKDQAPTPAAATAAGTLPVKAQEVPGPKREHQVSGWQQFKILSSRNVRILTRDRFSLILMLAAPILVSLLDVILALVLGRDPFDFTEGSMPNVMITLFLLTVYGVMVGGLSQMREIVKEQDVYKRERLVNLRLFPYIMSKVWVAALLSIYAALVYMGVHYVAFDMPGGATEFVLMFITLALATMAGMMLGLFASAVAPNANAAPMIVVLLMLPQIVLGGALVPLPTAVTTPISTRWAFQSFMGITGSGSDVAADPCWDLDEETQKELTLDFKDENCRCMGTNVLREDSCNFPGVGQFYNPIIDQPEPQPFTEEAPLEPVEPARPEIPPQPVEPEDQSDQIAVAKWRDEVTAWQEQANQIQADFDAQMDLYRADVALYRAQVEDYQERALAAERAQVERRIAIESAVLPAEELIRQFEPGFGWSYVDKNDASAYRSMIIYTWAAQLLIIVVLFVLTMVMQKRKDAVK